MIAYLDSPVLLRVALKQKQSLKEYTSISEACASRLIKTECLRTLDRLHSTGRIKDRDFVAATEFIFESLDHIELIQISDELLDRSSQPSGLDLGTLDAIHLFSAVEWRSLRNVSPTFLTHDETLGRAARLFGFQVLGTQ